jgi:hypothetical protein
MNSVSLCSLAGRYDNPIPPQFLAPIDFLKIPAQAKIKPRNRFRQPGKPVLVPGRQPGNPFLGSLKLKRSKQIRAPLEGGGGLKSNVGSQEQRVLQSHDF